MGEAVDINAIRAAIASGMARKGFSRRKLAREAQVGETSVRDVLERTDNPGIGTLHKIASALELPFSAMTGASEVELAGEIGAGGRIAFFKEDHESEYVPRPPIAATDLIALRVAGESMLPKYEPGDIVYVRRQHDGILPEYIGDYCAVHAADGGTYLKVLARGTEPGRFTLRSLNAADMENVEVVWASPILFIMPRRVAEGRR